MSDEIEDLIRDTSSAPLKSTDLPHFIELIRLILSNQYVRIPSTRAEEVYKVIRGSGMGLSCSGAIADFVLYVLMEQHFAVCHDIHTEYDVKAYFRFKDDIILCIGGSTESRRISIGKLRDRAQYFKL